MNLEEISKTIDDYHKLEKLAINVIKRINGDDAYDLTIDVIEKYSLLDIDYMYFFRGYSYDDNLIIPIKMLDASDEEIEEFKEKRRKEAERAAEENKLQEEKEKIKQEKAELARLKRKYETSEIA